MALRAMNNQEKEAAKILKDNGFYVFFHQSGNHFGYYATHSKLIFMYHIGTCANDAIRDLSIKQTPKNEQLTMNFQ